MCIPGWFRLTSGDAIDDRAVGRRLVAGTERQQRLEGGVRVAAAAVAEGELVQVGRQVLDRALAVGAVHPGLEVRHRPVRPREELLAERRGVLAAWTVVVAQLAQARIARPGVAVHDRAGRGRGLDEGAERV